MCGKWVWFFSWYNMRWNHMWVTDAIKSPGSVKGPGGSRQKLEYI